MALHCASNELLRGLLGLGSTQHGGHRFSVGNLLRVVRAPLMVEVTVAVEVTMVTAMMEVTVVVEAAMVEVTTVMVVTVVMVVATVVVEVTAMVEVAVMVKVTAVVEVTTVVVVTVVVVVVATVVVEVTAVERFRGRLLEFAAHLQEFRHWDVAGVAAGEVRTALGIALYDSLDSGGHLGAFRQRAAVMTCHVLSTLPVAFDNLEAFIAAFLHVLHGMRLGVAIAMVPHLRNALGEIILLDVPVIVAGHHKTTKAKKAGEERHE